MNPKRLATFLVSAGLAIGAIGAGVSAQYTDTATAQANAVYVGSFGCQLSTTTPGAVVTDNGHTVTYTENPILSSNPGSPEHLSITVTNSGSISAVVHWTLSQTPGYPASTDLFIAHGSPSMDADISPLDPGASKTYSNLGFSYFTLTNLSLDKTVTATYHADCTEFVPAASSIQFVGAVSGLGTAAMALPSGWQAGDIAVAMSWRASGGASGVPTGFTYISGASYNGGTGMSGSRIGGRVLQAGDTTFAPATNTTSTIIAVYRHATVGHYSVLNNSVARNYVSCTTPGLAPAAPWVDPGASSLSLGSSWVVCVGADSNTTTHSMAGFNVPAAANRAAVSDARFGLADTHGGVSSFPTANFTTGTTSTMGAAAWTIELVPAP